MTTFTLIALLGTGAVGMLGWFFAWRSRGEVSEIRTQLADAVAGETVARQLALEANTRAVAADTRYGAEHAVRLQLEDQLDSERASKQSLVDALAKSGAPVGPVVVDSALDGLYKNSDQGGSDPGSSAGGDPSGLSGAAAAPTSTPTPR